MENRQEDGSIVENRQGDGSIADKGTVLLYWQTNENMLYYYRGEKKCQGKPEKRVKQTYII